MVSFSHVKRALIRTRQATAGFLIQRVRRTLVFWIFLLLGLRKLWAGPLEREAYRGINLPVDFTYALPNPTHGFQILFLLTSLSLFRDASDKVSVLSVADGAARLPSGMYIVALLLLLLG